MESLQDITNLITRDEWLSSVDLKDAFLTIPLQNKYRKYFLFQHEGILYDVYGMPNGFGPEIRIFSKQLKPAFSFLRHNGYIYIYISGIFDTHLQGHICTLTVLRTLKQLYREAWLY